MPVEPSPGPAKRPAHTLPCRLRSQVIATAEAGAAQTAVSWLIVESRSARPRARSVPQNGASDRWAWPFLGPHQLRLSPGFGGSECSYFQQTPSELKVRVWAVSTSARCGHTDWLPLNKSSHGQSHTISWAHLLRKCPFLAPSSETGRGSTPSHVDPSGVATRPPDLSSLWSRRP